MADLTNKLKNRARREEQRENFSAAIELYSRALRVSERGGAVDVSLYNRIGDIYLRLDDVDSAVGYYERAILRYAEQDLYTSAIALCNKVLRVQPSRISAHLQLGRLQLETGLMAEARVNYLRYATELLTRGQPDEAEAALEEYVVRTEDLNSALRFAGALVANDRGDEALSLLLRLRTRLQSLDWDVAPLERPIAAIRGFDARPPAAADTDAPAAASETAGTEAPAGAEAEVDSIGDLEAELEAAVEPEPAAVEAGSAPPEASEAPPEAEPASDDPAPEVQEAPVAESAEPPLEEAGAGLAADESEAPDRGAESGPPPAPTLAEPEASEVSEDDDRSPRVPPEVTEQVEVALESPDGRGDPEVEPAEPARQDTEPEPRRREVESVEMAEGAERPAEDLRPTPGWRPAEGIEVDETVQADAPTDGAKPPAVEPGEGAWVGAIDAVDTDSGPSPEQSEVASDDSPEAGGTTEAASLRPAGEGSEPSLAAEPAESPPEAPAASDAPEDEVTAPAARLGARPAHELPERAVETATTPSGDEARPEERPEASEAATAGARLAAEGSGSLPSTEEIESGSERAGGRAAADATTWSPELEASEVVPETPLRTPTGPPLDADAAESVEPEPPPEERTSEVEVARRSLETGRELIERGELDRAIEELERAARSPICFLEAYELLQECRAERDAKAVAAAEPASPREFEPEVEPQPVAGSESETRPEVVEGEAEPDVVSEPEAQPEVAEPRKPEPVAESDREVEPDAAEPQPEAEPLPDVAVGPAEPTRSSWLLSTARASAEEEDRGIAAESVEQTPDGGRPPDEPFRLWLSAASYEVLKRALEELERREELQRALCVVERMLELKPEETSLHRIRIARAAELGRDDLLPEAYMELATRLESSGDLLAARGAYERVQELDPERPELADRLAGLEERMAESGLAITAPSEAEFEEDDEAPEEAGIPTPHSAFADDGSDEPLPEGERSPVQVYRGVVQDLQGGPTGRTVPEVEPVGDVLEAAREASVDFDVILAELKDQLAERVVDEPDGRSRTEVGERLMEMGLLDDAIRELQAAVRGPDAPPRAFELLGRAFVEKGQPRVAGRLLEEALDRLAEHTAEERLLGVLYQLGVACQESEESDKALECYERIFSVDIDYRDVRDRMDACAA